MIRFLWVSCSTIILIASNLLAEGSGGFAGAFLRTGLGARAIAMGNAQVATADYGYGAYYNAAALPDLKKKYFSTSHRFMSLDRQFDYIGGAMTVGQFAGAHIGWIRSGVGNFRAYGSTGQDLGKLDNGDHAIYASFGVRIIELIQADKQLLNLPSDLINLGISIKFLWGGISDDKDDFKLSSSGLGIDLGVLIKLHPLLTLGYQLKDLNASLSSNSSSIFERGSNIKNDFPLTQKTGLFYQTPWKGISLAYDFEWNNAGTEKQHLGMEVKSHGIIGRFGYNHDHFTLGGGLDLQLYKNINGILDYAFIDSVIDEGVSHVFSWQFLF